MSYDLGHSNRGGLGEVAIDAGSPLIAWANAVRNRGNATSLMPSQSDASVRGLLAEKIWAAKIAPQRPADINALLLNGYWYVPASSTNQRLYAALNQTYKDALARDKFWDSVQPAQLAKTGLKAVGTLAREGVSAVTGIPAWAIPVVLIAGGAYALHVVMAGVGDGVRRL